MRTGRCQTTSLIVEGRRLFLLRTAQYSLCCQSLHTRTLVARAQPKFQIETVNTLDLSMAATTSTNGFTAASGPGAEPAAPSSQELARYLEVAVAAAKAAGAIIAAAFYDPNKRVHHKGAVDLVTETDRKCEALVKQHIAAAFPSHAFIGEEASADAGGQGSLGPEPTWMVDPLDGTTNFVHSFPFSCTSIALCIGRRPVVGVVYNPTLEELYTATLGGGAQLNGQPISVSDTSELSSALFATEIGTTRDPATVDAIFDRVRTLTAAARSLRCCGSCAMNLCGVASGRLDAFYEIGFGGCWDVAAGALIVQEAGGVVLDPCGAPFDVMGRRVLGANGEALVRQIATLLAGCKTSPNEPAAPGQQH